ncbi:hypothetical protein WISP_125954 [Willisornis vidua]|uniref:Uncharacterized protein n=1 Tax=Willisornis vidua TaxID=1566151 RepID=A0ABQ9CR47_9PASS|nr:hypothetical protein WISP_125954 [Willisornis vidua]
MGRRRRLKESLHNLLNAEGSIATDEEKAEVLNAFFASVFNIKTSCPQDTQVPELEVGDGQMSEVPIIQEEMVSDLLCQLDTHKSMGPEGIHPRVMRELVKELAKALSIIYQYSWLTGKVLADCIFINKIDKRIKCTLTKLSGTINTPEGQDVIYSGLDKLEKWAHGNVMKFSKMCKMYLGQGNPQYQYRLWDEEIESSNPEKDLGVLRDELAVLYCEGGEAVKQVVQRSCECPIPASVQSQADWSSEESGLGEGVPAHGKG